MHHALKEAELAIEQGEVPVGAVFVAHQLNGAEMDFSAGSIVARGHNLTNRTRNVCKSNYVLLEVTLFHPAIHLPPQN